MTLAVEPVSIDEQREFNGAVFPLVLAPALKGGDSNGVASNGQSSSTEDAVGWIEANKSAIEDQLVKHGAILFRGLAISDAAAFNDFVEAFGYEELPYLGGAAPRTQVAKRVFTANESPPESTIPFHHEMAQVPNFPSKLFFFCESPAAEGGATPICLSDAVYEKMAAAWPAFVSALEEKGVRYTRIIPEYDDKQSAQGRGWRSTFLTDNKKEAEEKCRALGMDCEWLANGDLKTVTGALSAVREDKRTGRKVWFNSVVAAYTGWKDTRNVPEKAVTFADGTPLDGAAVYACKDLMNEVAVDFTWQKGDVLLVDNLRAMHGRRSFKPPRRILASLAK